ncbi:MAG: exodeoxyribonuclease VII small subunit [Lachnospiraceae bacterium]|nr:exodeoxyribonuclease VII small subunit [Lachnospiraceae bacterium]
MAKKEEKKLTLEEKLGALEETIKGLEAEDVSLEDSFSLYQKGMNLLKDCNAEIDYVEKQVQILNEQGETIGELQ